MAALSDAAVHFFFLHDATTGLSRVPERASGERRVADRAEQWEWRTCVLGSLRRSPRLNDHRQEGDKTSAWQCMPRRSHDGMMGVHGTMMMLSFYSLCQQKRKRSCSNSNKETAILFLKEPDHVIFNQMPCGCCCWDRRPATFHRPSDPYLQKQLSGWLYE
jgi:hypothetical protein